MTNEQTISNEIIATKVMGWHIAEVNTVKGFSKTGLVWQDLSKLPDFLSDHNAAMMVVEKMREDGWVISMAYDLMSSAMPMPFVAAFYKPTDPINSFRGYSESLCHAICSAALTAKGIKHDLLHRCR